VVELRLRSFALLRTAQDDRRLLFWMIAFVFINVTAEAVGTYTSVAISFFKARIAGSLRL
jgi:hypothetical protein